MTDNEIIKVMESSKECCDVDVNVFEFLNEVIDLINRQKAEIEKLKTDLEFKCDNCENIRLTRKEYK